MAPVSRAQRKTERITLRLQPKWAEAMNTLVELGRVDSVSAAIRTAVREYVERNFPQAPQVRATESNVDALKEIAIQEMVRAQVAQELSKKRSELSRP